ncbi:hypothetical protein M422DRAFT_251632 [Sphaerobolus stellatus SS14]|uniref:Uncharacterized protein n=1 Tax=Sphaerobolus stellatus (strain SS14) TaxID=990650 RepID=A0A0C9W207_SPHS4|nr:hypothetical protein M422DRAFT_251632 [Sphaerobolus stellatus SS14]
MFNSCFYVFAGDPTIGGPMYKDFYYLDLQKMDKWWCLPDYPAQIIHFDSHDSGTGWSNFVICVWGDKAYLFTCRLIVDYFNLKKKGWERNMHIVDGKMYKFGGFYIDCLLGNNLLLKLDLQTKTWRRLSGRVQLKPDPLYPGWTKRALIDNTNIIESHGARRYKPVDRKVRPVPTYMPNPAAQQFKPIPLPHILPLPFFPPPISEFRPTSRFTQERFDLLLKTIPHGFLSDTEIALLMHVVDRRQGAFAFTFAEKGIFKLPKALEQAVREAIIEQEQAGPFEPTTASYRSALFAVLKKLGLIRLVLDLQDLNAMVIRHSALPPRVEDFAEGLIGRAIHCETFSDLKYLRNLSVLDRMPV